MILSTITPLQAQISGESPAAILRTRPDSRLYVAADSRLPPEMIMPRTVSLVPEDSAYDNYGLLGAVIGGVTVGLAISLSLCREDCNLGKAILFGTPLLGIPGFVVGGLIGAGIKKPPKDSAAEDDPADEDEATRKDPDPPPTSQRDVGADRMLARRWVAGGA
jgi:hypothetical protein